jgi:hypothetical protein
MGFHVEKQFNKVIEHVRRPTFRERPKNLLICNQEKAVICR